MEHTLKHIVITGGTSGVGRELVKLLAGSHQLTVIGRRTWRSESLLADFPEIGFVDADLAEPGGTQKVRDAIPAGPLHGLINCAAVQYTTHFIARDFDIATIRREVALNLTAPAELIALFLPDLLQQDESYILNINSGLAIVPKADSAVYCGTKAALDSLSRSLRAQLSGTQVKVLQAFLPVVDTPMTAGRGGAKLCAEQAASAIFAGISARQEETDIGKVRFLRMIHRWAPGLARKIMLNSHD